MPYNLPGDEFRVLARLRKAIRGDVAAPRRTTSDDEKQGKGNVNFSQGQGRQGFTRRRTGRYVAQGNTKPDAEFRGCTKEEKVNKERDFWARSRRSRGDAVNQ